MTRPTLDDLREEDSPGILGRERLERAAPLMLEALKGVIAHPDAQPDDGTPLALWLRRVYDAIDAAEGKEAKP